MCLLIFFSELEFVLCSETQNMAVTDLDTCKNAVVDIKKSVPEANFYGEETESTYPKGCYMIESSDNKNGNVFYNKHSSGSSNEYARKICLKWKGE